MTDNSQIPPQNPDPAEEKKQSAQEPKFVLWGDKDVDPDVMFIRIDLKEPADDPTGNAAIYMLGFFEHAKNQAIAMVQAKRMQRHKSQILRPDGRLNLKIH